MLGFQTPVIVVGGTAVVYLVLILFSLRRRGFESRLHSLFILYLFMGIAWAIGNGVAIARGLVPLVPLYGAMTAMMTWAVLPVLLAALTVLFFGRPGAQWIGAVGAVWVFFVVLVAGNVGGMKDSFQQSLRLSTAAEAMNAVMLTGWAGFTGGALVLGVWDYVRIQRPMHRNRILYWLISTLLIGSGEGLTLLPGEAMMQVGAFTRMLGILLMAYATLTYYLRSVRNVVRKGSSVIVTTAATAVLFWCSFWLFRLLLQSLPGASAFVTAVAASVLLAIVVQPLRRAVADLVDNFFLGVGYDPALALRNYSAAITNILDLDALVTITLGIVSEALEIRRGALLLTTEREDGRVEVRVLPGMGEVSVQTGEFDPGSPILARLRQAGRSLSHYEIDILPEFRSALFWERAWLEQLNMELYVPVHRQSVLVGILALGGKASGAPYSTQDLTVLSTLADQAAVALQNARLVSDLKALNVEMTNLNDELIRTNRRLEKLDAAKTHFIQIASHELRTPLTQVRGYADIMSDVIQSGNPAPAQMTQISQGISRATVRLEEIIRAMLDVSEIDVQSLSLNRTPLTLTTALRMALEGYRNALQERRQTLKVEGIEELPPIQGDLQRLCQAFSNIIGNCIKYTPDGGAIRISGRYLQEAGRDGVSRGYVQVTIADTGIGIDPEDRELIFEKFYRVGSPDLHSTGATKFKGAGPGLGLPISRGVIQAHGGKIWVESPGHDEIRCPGSTFYVLLPVAPPATATEIISGGDMATSSA